MSESFEAMLTGGHPNSLGRTVEVFETVLANPGMLTALFDTYRSDDEVVRLRVSSALKRLAKADASFLLPVLDRLLSETADLDQASAQWTLADIFLIMRPEMDAAQVARASEILKRNLAAHNDWIVLNRTMITLGAWAKSDAGLAAWMAPHLARSAKDPRKSVARTAAKTAAML